MNLLIDLCFDSTFTRFVAYTYVYSSLNIRMHKYINMTIMVRLRIFMEYHIFMNISKGTESKQRW